MSKGSGHDEHRKKETSDSLLSLFLLLIRNISTILLRKALRGVGHE